MTDQVQAALAQSPLEMSDEDLLKLDPSAFAGEVSFETPEVKEEEETPEAPVAEESAEAPESQETEGSEEEKEQEETDDAQAGEGKPESSPETPNEETPAAASEATPAEIDYKAEYERLMAPFKANGREVRVKNADDAMALMQMGVNYNKKMAGLKPYLKVIKTLENHGLMDENELAFLIDLKHKKPGAIEKLMKDSGIDPMDLDADKADSYSPGSYTVDDREIELDQVIEEIKDSPSFARTVDVVSNRWDAKSKEELAKFPPGLRIINSHMDSGIYDLIMNEVENERTFGRLQGLSDLEAYRQVGDQLQARGAFEHLGRQGQQTPVAPKVVVPNPKKEDDSKLREKRRAASPTKTQGAGASKPTFDPLALSDEEFSKLSTQRFL